MKRHWELFITIKFIRLDYFFKKITDDDIQEDIFKNFVIKPFKAKNIFSTEIMNEIFKFRLVLSRTFEPKKILPM